MRGSLRIAAAVATELKVDETEVQRFIRPLLKNALIKAADRLERMARSAQFRSSETISLSPRASRPTAGLRTALSGAKIDESRR